MRVQFSVTESEWQKLLQIAKKEGYPDVPSYCKDLALKERTFGELWKTVQEKISRMGTDDQFALSNLVDTPPSNLGVKLYQNQKELGIQVLKKNNNGSNVFIKL